MSNCYNGYMVNNNNKNILVLVQQMGFAATDAVTGLKLVERGVPKVCNLRPISSRK